MPSIADRIFQTKKTFWCKKEKKTTLCFQAELVSTALLVLRPPPVFDWLKYHTEQFDFRLFCLLVVVAAG